MVEEINAFINLNTPRESFDVKQDTAASLDLREPEANRLACRICPSGSHSAGHRLQLQLIFFELFVQGITINT